MQIKLDDLTGAAIIGLLQQHLHEMHLTSPPESVHALDLSGLKTADVSFWTLWMSPPTAPDEAAPPPLQLAGCGALKQLDAQSAEVKSMRTAEPFRRQGVAATMLTHLIETSRARGYQQLYLETGSMAYFAPARTLYQRFGFDYCAPFAGYQPDPNSVFMVKQL